jgi:hypothetical protein
MTREEWSQHVADAFSSAVKATYEDLLREAVLAEREACAKIADMWVRAYPHPSQTIAESIRARGEA